MRPFYLCFVALFFAIPQVGSAAIIETGQDLQKACHTPDELSACLTFLQAVHKTAKEIALADDAGSRRIVGSCGPDKGIDTLPLAVWLRDAWYAYAKRHPDRLNQRAAAAALHAFEQQWPCGNGDKQ